MTTNNLKCPKCKNGTLIYNKETEGRICINCGYAIKGTHEVHALLQANSKEIASDYQKYGLKYTLHKWGISAKALYNLSEIIELRNEYPKFHHIVKQINGEENSNGHSPQLPVFNNEWTSEVQLKWLDIYDKILMKGV